MVIVTNGVTGVMQLVHLMSSAGSCTTGAGAVHAGGPGAFILGAAHGGNIIRTVSGKVALDPFHHLGWGVAVHQNAPYADLVVRRRIMVRG